MSIRAALHQRLIGVIQARGLTQVADTLNVDPGYLSKVYHNKVKMSSDTLEKYLAELGYRVIINTKDMR
jgi:transcriptional regulator with XRE-family HTH domain